MVRHLLADGWQVRALTRDPTSPAARAARDRGAELHQVDLDRPESLASPFDGAHGVFNVQNPMTSSIEDEVRRGFAVADAAAEAGVRHVVYGAAGVGDQPTGVGSWDSKLAIAQRFRDRGLPLTVLRPMAFMELMTDKGYYPQFAVWQLMPRLMGASRPVGWLCTDDLGRIAARVFADPARWVGADLSLAADVQSIEECKAIWRQVTGRRPKSWPMPRWLFERFVGTDLTTMWRWLRANYFQPSTETARQVLPDALTVADWLRRSRSQGG